MSQINHNSVGWRFNRQISLSVIVQLVFLGALIVGSWVNLQRQLCLLQHDMATLIQTQKQFHQRLEEISTQSTAHEYRLRSIEKCMPNSNISDSSL